MAAPPDERWHEDGAVTVVWRREYPDPPEDVWSAITESDRLGRWIGTWTGEARVGGAVAFTMTGEIDAGGEECEPMDVTILACDPPERLAVELPGDAGQAWRVELTVEPSGDGSVLHFAQRFAAGTRRDDIEAGWQWYLDRLTASLQGTAMPDWVDYEP